MVRHACFLGAALLCLAPMVAQAETYKLDQAHTSVVFRAKHLGMSYTVGRFNEFEGELTLDGSNSSLETTINAASVDTGNDDRDDHLRGPDFFNVKAHPSIRFVSKSAQMKGDTLMLKGELTLHGVSKPLTLELKKLGEGQGPRGKYRVGFEFDTTIKRSEFGMDKLLDAVGDEVHIYVSFEAIRQ